MLSIISTNGVVCTVRCSCGHEMRTTFSNLLIKCYKCGATAQATCNYKHIEIVKQSEPYKVKQPKPGAAKSAELDFEI